MPRRRCFTRRSDDWGGSSSRSRAPPSRWKADASRVESGMTAEPGREKAKRRDFLKLVGLGGIAGAAALAAGGTPQAAEAAAKPEPSGYRETPHVRKYYDTAKF